MTTTRFEFTRRARPIMEVGIGATIFDTSSARWDVALWDAATSTWNGVDPMWRDVSCDVIDSHIELGRGRITDAFPVGTAEIVVDNDSGWADPSVNLEPEPGVLQLRPGMPLRVGVEHDVLGTRWLYYGFIDEIVPNDAPDDWSTVRLSCIDALGEAGRAKLADTDETGASEFAYTRFNRLLDEINWPDEKRDVSTSAVRELYAATFDGQIVDLLRQTAESEGGWCFGDGDGNIVLQQRDWLYHVTGSDPDASIGNVDIGDVLFVDEPPGSFLMTYLGDAGDWVEDPVGSGLYEWAGS